MKAAFEKAKAIIPAMMRIPDFDPDGDFAGIQAITYEGMPLDGQKTKVFAYLGYPEHGKRPAPAVLLVHGGGGVPYLEWVKMWNERGYVALAMSTTGDFPKQRNAGITEGSKADFWQHGLHGSFAEPGFTDAPDNDSMQNSHLPLQRQWMYHAVGQVILANSLLRNDPQVDPEKIGIVGISWGGVITSLVIGYDERLAVAVPIYGSGYLAESKGTLGEYFRAGENPALWLAEKQFSQVRIPVMWLCWNRDLPFSLNSNSKSYLDTVKNNPDTRLSAVDNMHHAHTWGWVRKESFAFADFVCKGKKRLPTFREQDGRFVIDNPDHCLLAVVKLYYIDRPLSYSADHKMEQDWKVLEYEYPYDSFCYEIPAEAKAYYLELTTLMYTDVYITCSPFVEL